MDGRVPRHVKAEVARRRLSGVCLVWLQNLPKGGKHTSRQPWGNPRETAGDSIVQSSNRVLRSVSDPSFCVPVEPARAATFVGGLWLRQGARRFGRRQWQRDGRRWREGP